MNVTQITCGTCCGQGFIGNYVPIGETDEHGIYRAQYVKEECQVCGGKGYTEYAMFTVEEARQIMKVCGLPQKF